MELENEKNGQNGEMYEEAFTFPECEFADRIFAFIYLVVGYGFVYVFSSRAFERNLAVFTVCYAAAVLWYLAGKKIQPPKESWFWLAVMLAIGIPYAFWSVLYILQVLALTAAAAYWTLCVSGGLLQGGRTSQWIFFDGWNAMILIPFGNFDCQTRVLLSGVQQQGAKKESRIGAVLLGLVITIPVLIIILPLLSRADAGFQYAIGNLADYISEHLIAVFLRMIFAVPVSFYLYGLLFGGIHKRNTDRIHADRLSANMKKMRKVPDTAVCTMLAVICFVYLLFIGLQGKYLFSAFAGVIPENFTYAEYARRGFFELCQIGVWNIVFLGFSGAFSRTDRREHTGLGFLTVALSVLTLLLLLTAVSKLGMYMSVYGLTVNRVLPLVFMIWMAIVFLCLIVRQKKEFPMVRFCTMAGAVLFCLLCVLPVERLTMLYNVWARAHGYIV